MQKIRFQVFDVDIPLISAYLHYWWNFGPEGPNQGELVNTWLFSMKHIFVKPYRMYNRKILTGSK